MSWYRRQNLVISLPKPHSALVMIDVLLTTWTIRLALGCYAIVLVGWLIVGERSFWPRVGRMVWSVGCLLYLLHVVCAFHFYHDWSHPNAVEHTAWATEQLLGWQFGAGVYFNYVFTLLWAADAGWWSLSPGSYMKRSCWIGALNGAVVFEDGPTRWVGVVVGAVLLVLLLRRLLGKKAFDA